MRLIQPTDHHLISMMSWFSNHQELANWSGPNFRYPYDLASFTEDLKLNTLRSFALVTDDELLAFGQYYLRLGRCHLGRLVVNPNYRGQGIAAELMTKLIETGQQDLNVHECSLFVLTHNTHAMKAYKKFGFLMAEYPDVISLENCLYMVKP